MVRHSGMYNSLCTRVLSFFFWCCSNTLTRRRYILIVSLARNRRVQEKMSMSESVMRSSTFSGVMSGVIYVVTAVLYTCRRTGSVKKRRRPSYGSARLYHCSPRASLDASFLFLAFLLLPPSAGRRGRTSRADTCWFLARDGSPTYPYVRAGSRG